MRVLFFDIDGVLNSLRTFEVLNESFSEEWSPIELYRNMLDDNMVHRLQAISNELDLTLVAATSWRSYPWFFELMDQVGLDVADSIPILDDMSRGREIRAWLESRGEDVDDFLILDDEDDMEDLIDRLVQTSMETGLTENHVAEIRRRF